MQTLNTKTLYVRANDGTFSRVKGHKGSDVSWVGAVYLISIITLTTAVFAVYYPAQMFTLTLIGAVVAFAWRKRWEILALRQGFVTETVELSQDVQPKKNKRHYEKRMVVHHYQSGTIKV